MVTIVTISNAPRTTPITIPAIAPVKIINILNDLKQLPALNPFLEPEEGDDIGAKEEEVVEDVRTGKSTTSKIVQTAL